MSKKIRIPKRNVLGKFETVQVGTGINPDKLQVSQKRKEEIKYEVLVETANMSDMEIKEIVQGWANEPYGNDEDIYKIFELKQMLNARARDELGRRIEVASVKNERMFGSNIIEPESDKFICRR